MKRIPQKLEEWATGGDWVLIGMVRIA